MDQIRIRGARQHNLQNVDVDLPRGKLVVITGPSGSGKSSLAFQTLYAEGQRRYVETLSVYARQFLDQLEKPDVDWIDGLSPAIAIEQRSGGLNPRSTVATVTEIYDYLRVLWAAAGVPHDPTSGEPLVRMGPPEIVSALMALPAESKVILLAPIPKAELVEPLRFLGDLQRQGFIRVRVNGEIKEIEDAARDWPETASSVEVVVDRFIVRPGSESRVADSMETTLRLCGAEARASIQEPGSTLWRDLAFQTAYRNPTTGFTIEELTPKMFSFNSHLGACAACEGLGTEQFCDPELLMNDPDAPLIAGGLRGWWNEKTPRHAQFLRDVKALLQANQLSQDSSFRELGPELQKILLEGGSVDTGWKVGAAKKPQMRKIEGLLNEAVRKYHNATSEASRRRLARVMNQRPCSACHGRRLKPEWLAVKLQGPRNRWLGIQEFCDLPVGDAIEWLEGVQLESSSAAVCRRLINDVLTRLHFLTEVGLDYLGLNRASSTLSGGEAQRIRLASQLGVGLEGVIYVLDEPSIGLHAADIDRLIGALLKLRDLGNTVVVVEHDEEIIRSADHVIDMGPGAGKQGGHVLDAAPPLRLDSPTGKWLSSRANAWPSRRPIATLSPGELRIRNAREHNLQNLDITLPLGRLVCLCGPSGSGKSTLADDILRKSLNRFLNGTGPSPGAHDAVEGMELIAKCIVADQSPIGRSPRSNPATFTGAFDLIRALFAKLPSARQRGYAAGRFSFNMAGGRCERCQGNGRLRMEMNFLPDAWVTCPACNGKRFNRETLEVTYKGQSIADVLDLSVAAARELFRPVPKLLQILTLLDDLGLGYLALGQAANTLSGGEAQRLKLAVELARPQASHTLYLFDEPTTGLHFGDVQRLLDALFRLRDAGHSVIIVEHNLDVIAASDWVVELGPGGGKHGGQVIAWGPPERLREANKTPTSRALAKLAKSD